jgi:hypothetical protein
MGDKVTESKSADLVPWYAAVYETKISELKLSLTENRGNVSRTAEALGLDRSHVKRLVERFELRAFVDGLRLAAGGTRVRTGSRQGDVMGRPRKTVKKVAQPDPVKPEP